MEIKQIKLGDLVVNHEWNGRSGDWAKDTGKADATNDFKELKKSIELKGQLTPVTVRPSGKKFELVAGFRRFEAIRQLANGDDNATIIADVRKLTDLQAREINLIENTERQDLKPADICWSAGQLLQEALKSGVKMTQAEMAGVLGVTQPYVSDFLKICEHLPKEYLEQWRLHARDLPVKSVLRVALIEKAKQKEAWEALINPPKSIQSTKGGKAGQIESLQRKAREMGLKLGQLAYNDLIDASNLEFNLLSLEILVALPVKKEDGSLKLTQEEVDAIVASLEAGFDAGNREQPGEKAAE